MFKNILWRLRNTKVISFIRNTWLFRKELTEFRDYDSSYNLSLSARSFELLADNIENGFEYYKDRIPKVTKIRRVVEIMRNLSDESKYIELAEENLGFEVGGSFKNDFEFKELPLTESGEIFYELVDHRPEDVKKRNNQIFDLSDELQINELEELTELIKGNSVVSYRIQKITGNQPQFKRGNGGILSWWN